MNDTDRRALGAAVRTVIDRRFAVYAEAAKTLRMLVASALRRANDLDRRLSAIEARLGTDPPPPSRTAHAPMTSFRTRSVAAFRARARSNRR